MFVEDASPPSQGDGVTLCELNGALLTGEHTKFRVALPAASPDAASGYGFELPQLPAQQLRQPGRALKLHHPSPPARASAIAAAAGRLHAALKRERPPPPPPPPAAAARPFAWQPAHAAPPAAPSDPPARPNLCAAALADHSVALYDLSRREWSPHKLVHTHQTDVRALAWQPEGCAVLAVGGGKGVCIWRLTFSPHSAELSGAHMLRLLEVAAASPVRALAWHPLGAWLACAASSHLSVCDAAGGGRGVELWGAAVELLQLSPCGRLLLASAGAGRLRVWETRRWGWESWRRFAAPCAAAAWSGPPPLGGAAARTLLLALRGEAVVHALRFPTYAGMRAPRGEYIGHYDLSALLCTASLSIRSLDWAASGTRLVVGWEGKAEGRGEGGAEAREEGEAELTVLCTRTHPTLHLQLLGHVQGHARGAALSGTSFSSVLDQGPLLTAAWADGRFSLLPLFS